MTIGTWAILGVIIAGLIGLFVRGKKQVWYKVYCANNDVLHVYRLVGDWWFRDGQGLIGFRLADGTKIKVARHWILKVEEDKVHEPAE